jgi:hypothetical protein
VNRKSNGQPSLRQGIVLGSVLILFLLIIAAYSYEWTGFPGKTIWHWLDLLIVPAAVAVGVLLLDQRQRQRDQQAGRERRRREQEMEELQREHELEVEDERAQDTAMQAYLDRMSQLLFDQARPLHISKKNAPERTLARARTLTVLARLKGERKGSLLQFLYESALIRAHNDREPTIVPLIGVDLSGVALRDADLRGVDLHEADLSKATLSAADLRGADLQGADLWEATLDGAIVTNADLDGADLSNARLNGAMQIGRNRE